MKQREISIFNQPVDLIKLKIFSVMKLESFVKNACERKHSFAKKNVNGRRNKDFSSYPFDEPITACQLKEGNLPCGPYVKI